MRRLPSQPPVLPGFSHVHVLGSGGFADVFLYEQQMPRRQVAVKVLLSEVVDEHVRELFRAEADLMAQLSAHPAILTVHQAGVSADGRPYLVMELCSAGLTRRYRAERIPVAEVLRIAVRIGSAIETAHRAGVLHRDIKPANILTTAYGHPVLSDFGIAASLSAGGEHASVGLSIPWSAPEVLMDETGGSTASEVWSFAATVYSLLAGRSPFEQPGQSNDSAELISRINRARLPGIDRPDVPVSLERALARGMSRNPQQRPASVLALVHELQAVETELGYPQTPAEVAREPWSLPGAAEQDERTVVRPASGAVVSVAERRRQRREGTGQAAAEPGTDSVARPRSTGRLPAARRRVPAVAWIAAAVGVLGAVIGLSALLLALADRAETIPQVTGIEARVVGSTVEFSWPDPGLEPGDAYQVQLAGAAPVQQRTASFTVDAAPGQQLCAQVLVVREGRAGPAGAEKCVDVPE